MGVALVGAALGALLVFTVVFSWPKQNREFAHESGDFLIWLMIILAQTAAWPLVAALIWWNVERVAPLASKEHIGRIAVSAVLFALGAMAFTVFAVWVPKLSNWLPQYRVRLTINADEIDTLKG